MSDKSTPLRQFYQLKCSCNSYPWGKQGSASRAATLCAKTPGFDSSDRSKPFKLDEREPYAEMWMGTYPELPSYIADTGESLQTVLNRYPMRLLGNQVPVKFGDYLLPFLPKVLSIAKALPLQIHPNKEFATKMHKENPDDFTDPNHKPEIALALSTFEAFCGWKPLADIAALLNTDGLSHLLGTGAASSGIFTNEDLRNLVQKILSADDATIEKIYKNLTSLPETAFESPGNAHIPSLTPRLVEDFSKADPGVIVALIAMNFLTLQPGECVYIPADGIHAYVSGDIIECMARSNNVLNTGFCPRAERANAAQFCKLLSFNPHSKEQCMLAPKKYGRSEKGKTVLYQPPLNEFNVLQTELAGGEEEVLGKGGAGIVIATTGSARVKTSDAEFELGEGHVYFVAHGTKLEIKAGNDGLLMHTSYVE